MELTIINQQGKLLVDSREIAEMVGKEHKNLMRDIRNYIDILDSSTLGTPNFFIESNYINSQNKTQPCYLLTKKGCDMVANKMIGEKGILFTATYVTKFDEMENKLKTQQLQLPTTYKEALVALLASVEENERLLETIEEQKPLVRFAETVSESSDSIEVGQFAKLINDENIPLGRNKLFNWLRDNKYLQSGSHKNEPYQKYIDNNVFEVIEVPFKTPYGDKLTIKTLITGKGQIYLVEKLKKEFK